MAEEPSNIPTIFADFQAHLSSEQELREGQEKSKEENAFFVAAVRTCFKTGPKLTHTVCQEIRTAVRDLEQTARVIYTGLQQVHQQDGIKTVSDLCDRVKPSFETIRTQWKVLSEKVPTNQYYRFHDHWKFVMQRLSFLAAFITYLKREQLVTREETAALNGVKVNKEEGFHIDLDDYLLGLLQLASELSRLAMNSVTAGDYARPLRIARFVAELDAGFRLLNLKNDALRKRFDGLKYDLKKVEEVVYDLTIRGLKPPEDTAK